MRRTARLRLRPFEDRDRDASAAINADPEVMAFFPAPLSHAESDELTDVVEEKRAALGFSFDAAEAGGRLIGFCGPSVPRPRPSRLASRSACARRVGRAGYASEAARDALGQAFGPLGIEEVVAFTAAGDRRSMAVMEQIEMVRDHGGEFDHPSILEASPLRRHALYPIGKDDHGRRCP